MFAAINIPVNLVCVFWVLFCWGGGVGGGRRGGDNPAQVSLGTSQRRGYERKKGFVTIMLRFGFHLLLVFFWL